MTGVLIRIAGDAQRAGHVTTEAGIRSWKGPARIYLGSEGTRPCPHLDLGLPASRTVRQHICFLPTVALSYSSPGKLINAHSLSSVNGSQDRHQTPWFSFCRVISPPSCLHLWKLDLKVPGSICCPYLFKSINPVIDPRVPRPNDQFSE